MWNPPRGFVKLKVNPLEVLFVAFGVVRLWIYMDFFYILINNVTHTRGEKGPDTPVRVWGVNGSGFGRSMGWVSNSSKVQFPTRAEKTSLMKRLWSTSHKKTKFNPSRTIVVSFWSNTSNGMCL